MPLFLFYLPLLLGTTLAADPRVIIIGAGPSGVAAATRLLEHNITDVTVLEAEDRIGGRINSVWIGDAYVDLGAHWCHGEEGNVVYEMVKDLDVLESTLSKPVAYFSSRGRIGFNEELMGAIDGAFQLRTNGVKDSVKDFYGAKYTEILVGTFGGDNEKLRLSLSSNRLLEQQILSYRGAFSLSSVIVDRDYRVCPGDLRLNWNGAGYKRILDVMIHRYPNPSEALPFDEKVHLNTEVSNVEWDSQDHRVKVTTADGESFEGDYVVFTGSVGVLKHYHEKLFTPSLPQTKREVIDEIGLDAIVDASFHFPQRWWGEDEEYFIVWEEEDIINEMDDILKHGKWVLDIFSVTTNPQNPNVLSIWIVGASVPEVEQLSDEAFLNGTLYVFRRFFNDFNVTTPDEFIRSNWYANPHFKGTYSYQTTNAHDRDPSAEVELSKPLTNSEGETTLLFAGEATHPYYYSTVHGAIETGYREADRIIELVKSL